MTKKASQLAKELCDQLYVTLVVLKPGGELRLAVSTTGLMQARYCDMLLKIRSKFPCRLAIDVEARDALSLHLKLRPGFSWGPVIE